MNTIDRDKLTVFLGGTCNGSRWREDYLLPQIDTHRVDAYNPVVPDWTPEVQAEEVRRRQKSDVIVYVITPRMTGTYAIAEVVDDSNKRPNRVVFMAVRTDVDGSRFDDKQWKSLLQVAKLVRYNGATVLQEQESLEGMHVLAKHLNQ